MRGRLGRIFLKGGRATALALELVPLSANTGRSFNVTLTLDFLEQIAGLPKKIIKHSFMHHKRLFSSLTLDAYQMPPASLSIPMP